MSLRWNAILHAFLIAICLIFSPIAHSIGQSGTARFSTEPAKNETWDGSYTLSWTKSGSFLGGIDLYEQKGSGSLVKILSRSYATSHSVSGKAEATYTYYLKARVEDFSNRFEPMVYYKTLDTINVVVDRLTLPPKMSTPNAPSTDADRKIYVSWSASAGEDVSKYQLQVLKSGQSSWSSIYSGSSRGYTYTAPSDGTYSFRVRAYNYAGWGSFSSSDSTITAIAPAVPPSMSTPTTDYDGTIRVDWTKPSGAVDEYQMQYQANNGSWLAAYTGTALSKTITLSDNRYRFRVRACNKESSYRNCSGYKYTNYVYIVRKPGTPSSISGVASVDTDGRLTVSWGSASGSVDKYQLNQKTNGTWSNILSSNVRTKSVTLAEGSYQFAVRACNDITGKTACSGWRYSGAMEVIFPPTRAVTLIAPKSDTDGSYSVSWNLDVSGLSEEAALLAEGQIGRYQVQERKNSGAWTTIVNNNTKNIARSNSDGAYRYRARACKVRNSQLACGTWYEKSNDVVVVKTPGTPATIGAPAIKRDGVALVSWGTSTGSVTEYQMQYRKNSGAWVNGYSGGTGTGKSLTLGDGSYHFRVKACNKVSTYTACSGYRTTSVSTVMADSPDYALTINAPSFSASGDYSVNWKLSLPGYSEEQRLLEEAKVVRYDVEEWDGSSWYTISNSLLISSQRSNSGGVYRYRARACDKVVGVVACSGWDEKSASTEVLEKPNNITNVTAPALDNDGKIRVEWTAPSNGADYYKIFQYDLSKEKSTGLELKHPELFLDLFELNQGQYKFKVSACNTANQQESCSGFTESSVVTIDLDPEVEDQIILSNLDQLPTDTNSLLQLKGSSSVDGGVFKYSIPLPLPPGRRGMTPDVSLNYNSDAGLSVAGYGWSLSSAGAISRCSTIYDIDKKIINAQYHSSDKLCLNGQRLINISGNYGESGTKYKTERDSSVVVTQYGAINSYGTSFEVVHKSGRVSFYGSSDNSRYTPVGAPAVLSWKLDKELDTFNNNIKYSYLANGGSHLLHAIYYTGTNDVNGTRSVLFDYELSEQRFSYHWGAKSENASKLTSVTISTPSQSQLFDLVYEQNQLKLLRQCVDLSCSSVAASLSFNWHSPDLSFSKLNSHVLDNIVDPESEHIRTTPLSYAGDFDGDGNSDYLNKERNIIFLAKHLLSSSTSGVSYNLNNLNLGAALRSDGKYTLNIMDGYLDYDGDGRSEVLYINDNYDWQLASFNIENNAFEANYDTGISALCPVDYGPASENFKYDKFCNSFVSDVNGDGYTDIISSSKSESGESTTVEIWLRKVDASGKSTEGFFMAYSLAGYKHNGLADIDGDGKPDLYDTERARWIKLPQNIREADATRYDDASYELELRNSIISQIDLGFDYAESDYLIRREKRAMWLDLNGDGQQDVLFLKPVGSGNDTKLMWFASLNQGAGLFTSPVNTNVQELLGYYEGGVAAPSENVSMTSFMQVFDYNEDGRADILLPNSKVYSYECFDHDYNQLCIDRDEQTKNFSPYYSYDIYTWKVLQTNEDGVSFTEVGLDSSIVGSLAATGLIDVNMDGRMDIASGLGFEMQWPTNVTSKGRQHTSPVEPEVAVYQRTPNHDNKMYQVHDTLGQKLEVTYDNLSGNHQDSRPIYTMAKSPLPDSRYVRVASNRMVVKKIGHRNAIGGMNEIEYSYSEGISNIQGRGFQGFRFIESKDLAQGLTKLEEFYQEFPYSGMVKSSHSWQSTTYDTDFNNAVARAINSNDIVEGEVQYYAPKFLFNQGLDNNYISEYKVTSIQPYWCEAPDCGSEHGIYGPHVAASVTKQNDLNTPSLNVSTKAISGITFNTNGTLQSKTTSISDKTMSLITTTLIDVETCDADGEIERIKSSSSSSDLTRKAWNASITESSDVTNKTITFSDFKACNTPKLVKTSTTDGSSLIAVKSIELDEYGNVTKEALSSEGAGQVIDSARWVSKDYGVDGYFVETTQNSQWGENINASVIVTDDYYGIATKVTDVNGIETHQVIDEFGQVIESFIQKDNVQPAPSIHTAYQLCTASMNCPTNAKAVVTKVQSANPTMITYVNAMGKVLKTQTSNFDASDYIVTTTSYDALGRVARTTLPHVEGSSFGYTDYTAYDAYGRLTAKSVHQYPSVFETTYQHTGLTTSITVTPDTAYHGITSLEMSRTYNSLKQLVQTIDAHDESSHFSYTAGGLPEVIMDANGNKIKASYNGHGHKTAVDDPNLGQWQYEYNALGELKWQQDGEKQVTTFVYDSLGRTTSKQSGGQAYSWVYDDVTKGYGYLSRDSKGSAYNREFNYDGFGRVLEKVLEVDGKKLLTGYQYDGYSGRLKRTEYNQDLFVSHSYHGTGAPKADVNVLTGKTLVNRTAYDVWGGVKHQTFGNNLVQSFERLASSGMLSYVCTDLTTTCNVNTALQYQGYEYDNFANLHIQTDYDVNQTTTYGYDALHRVTSSAVDHNGETYRADYGYDALGNFKYKSDYASNYQYETGSNRIDQVQRLDGTWQGFSYDGNGNLLTNDEGSLTNTYNTAMKPVQVIRYGNRLNFSYDANEFRYKQVKTANGNTSTIYYVDKDYELEIDDAGKETYTYYVGGHTIVKTTDTQDDVSHISTNRLGSVSLITNGNAKVSTSLPGLSIREHRGYDVFGRMYSLDNPQAITLGSEFTSRGFTAHEHLQSVQLIHMNGRAYDYNLGRFLSVDPFIQNPTNTQSINPYSYIMNNPLAGTDPTGYNSECQNEDAEVCADGDGTKGKTKIDDDTEKAATENGGKILVIVEKAKKRVKDRRSANKTGSIEDGYIIHGVIGEQSGGDGGTNQSQNTDLNLTQDEYLQAVKDGLWKGVSPEDGISDNNEVKSVANKVNARQATSDTDVSSEQGYIDFLKATSRATAKAKLNLPDGSQNGEKFLVLGKNASGEVIVMRIGVLTGQGGSISVRGAGAVAHVHYKGLVQRPDGADHSAVKFKGIPSFVIGQKGRKVWEVGRQDGNYMYRTVHRSKPGNWKTFKGAH